MIAHTNAMKKWRYIFTGAGMLAVSSVIAKLLGALYRIPLTNVVGSEGMGLYQMVFPLYTLLLTVSSGGLPVAISRLVAVKLASNDEKGATKVLKVSVCALSVVGLLGSLLLALLGRRIAIFQGNERATLAYLGIAPAVFLVAILSCLRGYYQGRENMLPTAVSQLLEQAIKLFAGLTFATMLMKRGVEYGVLGALLGVSLSEVVATLALSLAYGVTRRRHKINVAYARKRAKSVEMREDINFTLDEEKRLSLDERRQETVKSALRAKSLSRSKGRQLRKDIALASDENEKIKRIKSAVSNLEIAQDITAHSSLTAISVGLQESCVKHKQVNPNSVKKILKSIAKVALPVTFGSLVLPLTQVIDSVLIINILSAMGVTTQVATGAYGLLSGTVTTLINVPTVVVFSISVALLPKIAKACKDVESVRREATFSYKLCCALGLVASLFFFVYGEPLINTLYQRGLNLQQRQTAITLLKTSAISVFFVSIIQVSTALLQGLNCSSTPAKNLFVGALVKTVLTATLLPLIGIYGAVVGSVTCYALTAVLDIISVRKRVSINLQRKKCFVLPLASLVFLLSSLFFRSLTSSVWLLLTAVVGALALYMGVIFAFGWFEREEVGRILPFFKR